MHTVNACVWPYAELKPCDMELPVMLLGFFEHILLHAQCSRWLSFLAFHTGCEKVINDPQRPLPRGTPNPDQSALLHNTLFMRQRKGHSPVPLLGAMIVQIAGDAVPAVRHAAPPLQGLWVGHALLYTFTASSVRARRTRPYRGARYLDAPHDPRL